MNSVIYRLQKLIEKKKISPDAAKRLSRAEEEYTSRLKSLREEKENLTRLAKEIDQRQDNWHDLTVKTFNFACYAHY